jgi:TNF receptor-associated factor 2
MEIQRLLIQVSFLSCLSFDVVMVVQVETTERQRRSERELIDDLDRKVAAMERTMAVKDTTIAELELRMTSLESTSYDGTLLWRISDFSRRRQEAVQGRVTSIYSPAFFTNRTGRGTVLSVSMRCA